MNRLENVANFTEFVKAFSQFGTEMVELAHLTGDRQNVMKTHLHKPSKILTLKKFAFSKNLNTKIPFHSELNCKSSLYPFNPHKKTELSFTCVLYIIYK